jgi:acyl carrier protein phosphodiesterase
VNYLAHAYLSFKDPDILTGNLISDFVKGKKKFVYPIGIQKGIQLHRLIDEFTDQHEATAGIKQIFKPAYRLYAGAFADVVYDHFLAKDVKEFPDDSLLDFSSWVYTSLESYQDLFPERFKGMFPYMKQQNWLYNYRLKTGAERSFEGLVRRAAFLHDSRPAFHLLENHYEELQGFYDQFFPSIKEYAKKEFNRLTGN